MELLKDYGLDKFKDKKPGELSGGMKQRAALIRTLALDPEILLLDEPFSALDYQTRLSVSSDICSIIRSAGKTAILVTHDLSEAISLADRILVLSKRPATIKCDIPIHLTISGNSPSPPEMPRNTKDILINYGRRFQMKTMCKIRKSSGQALSNQEAYERTRLKHRRLVTLARLLVLVFFFLSGN